MSIGSVPGRVAETDVDTLRPADWQHDRLEGPVLIGGRCEACGHHFFPHRRICPDCFTADRMVAVRLSRRGRLYSYSVVRTPVRGYEVPYAVGYVDLQEGVRVFAQLEDWREDLPLDVEVELVIGRIRTSSDGRHVVGYKFRPVP